MKENYKEIQESDEYIRDMFFNPHEEFLREEGLLFMDMETRCSVLAERCRKVIRKLNDKGIYKYGTV